MSVSVDNVFLSVSVIAAFLLLILMGRAKRQRIRMILGGLGVAAAIVALALLGEALMRAP